MTAITKETHPTDEGWNHVEITLNEGKTCTDEEILSMALFFTAGLNANAEDYDIAIAPQESLVLKAATRRKAA